MKRLLLIAATILLIAGYVWLIGMLIDSRTENDWTDGEKEWVSERMAYHGIWSCEKDGGKYYFIRNGRRCEL